MRVDGLRNMRAAVSSACLWLAAMAMASAAFGQTAPPPKQPELGPSNNTELSLVMAAGNAESTSIGLRNVYEYHWPKASMRWETGWLAADSRDGDRYAVQNGTGFDVVDPGTATDSNRLFSKLHYQRQLSTRTDWFTDFDASRDQPANINHLYVLAGGLGTTWKNSPELFFRTGYGLTYTNEDLELEGDNQFAGYRLYYRLKALVATSTTAESELTFDGSFETGDDFRTDWLNSVTVAINSRMALKSSLRLLFRNLPALEAIGLRNAAGVTIGTVQVEKHALDTNFTTSLVIKF